MPTFYDFFSGGGMARGGLGSKWTCLFANDIDAPKGTSYAVNWGNDRLGIEDIGALTTADLPGRADLAWASFPCQDLSLAGNYAGLKGRHSGTFWPFWTLIRTLAQEKRAPSVVVLENVCGALTSHGGKDFGAIGAAMTNGGYLFGAVVIDAIHFVPQSRPRLFVVAVHKDRMLPSYLTTTQSSPVWHPANLVRAYENLSQRSKAAWVWWSLPVPPPRQSKLEDIIEDEPQGVTWHTTAETRYLLGMMSPINREKVRNAKRAKRRMVGGIYKRTRLDENGQRTQRAEIRFDGVAGCLRTPIGGSSRQSVMIVEGNRIRSRLLSPREAARLMGLPDTYKLPKSNNDAYHLCGDGVVVPVVRFLAVHLLQPLLAGSVERGGKAV